MKRADSLLHPLIRDLGIEDGIRLIEIKKNWHNLFKDPLSFHMSPCKLSEGEIILNVDSPVWLQELNYYKEDIIEKLSPYDVRDVRFRLGRVSAKVGASPPRFAERDRGGKRQGAKGGPLTTEELSYIEETVFQISDEKLKETVQRAMKKALIAKRNRK